MLYNGKLLKIVEDEVNITLTYNSDNNCSNGNAKIDLSKYNRPRVIISGATLATDHNYVVPAFFDKGNSTIYASRYGNKTGTILVKYFILY